ncbi:beta-1,3-glucanase family protein [Chitiniphilus shinanonensis]|uniref:beta-1,3-glucanase family protein n=1 Tax=Chitiniphilus shinanonensis TaxID=553088 RepID=UPI00306AACE4
MKMRWRVWLASLLAGLLWLMPAARAADYGQGVSVAGNVATIWFKSSVATTWVDIHYQVNSGATQNVRMAYSAGNARYEQQVNVASGTRLDYSFTYNNGTPAYDTGTFSYVVGGANPTPTATPTPQPTSAPASCAIWAEGNTYVAGTVVSYNGATYTALVTHTAYVGTNWNPAATPTLWRAGGSCGSQPTPTPNPTPTPTPNPTPTATPTPAGAAVPGRIQAEAWSAMSGVQTETTTDSGGGLNVGWIETGDWLDYRVNVATARSYTLQLRVASPNSGAALQLRNAAGAVLASVTVPNTGGWQNWVTVQTSVTLPAGNQVLRIHASNGGFNLNWLEFVAGSVTPTPTPVTPTPTPANPDLPVGSGAMTIKLENATRGTYGDQQVYWAIIGYDPTTRALSYVNRSGQLVPARVADNDAAGHLTKNGQNYANYFSTMSQTNWVSIPRIDSARLFISVGSPMFIKINLAADGLVGFAGPDLGNPTDPNQDVYFEWVEFTVDQYGYHGNSTRVDQFGFPIRTRLIGLDGYDRTLGETETREALFSAYERDVPAEFKSLVKRPYRIVAPGKGGFGHGGANSNYYTNYVNQVWSYYASNDLVFTAEAGTFRGRVIGNDFVFSKNGGPQNLYIRGKPVTQDIMEGSGNLAAGSAEEKVVQAQITAAFNRHLLLTVDPANWSNSAYYYLQAPANYFSKFWHDHSIDGLSYGFCYDDVRGHSSLLEHPSPKGLIVTVGW